MDRAVREAKAEADAAAQAISGLGSAAEGAAPSLTAVSEALGQTSARTKTLPSEMEVLAGHLRDLSGIALIVGGALDGITIALVGLATSSLEAAGKMEQQRVAMENLTHSATETNTLIHDLVDFAVKTPFEIPGVVEMGQKLVAMGTATKDVIPLLTTLGDAASGSGKGFAGLNTLVNDFGKMAQLGTVHMRELNTLAYQGVPAIQALADAFGVSTNRMRQMIEQNLVASADAIPILLQAMNDKFGGMMEAQSKTLLGMWSNLKDSITKTLIAIGDALTPAFKSMMSAIQPVLDIVQNLAERFGHLPVPVQTVALAAAGLLVAIGPVITALGVFAFAAGQIIEKLPGLAALVGVELPAAFTRSTIAVGANTTALEANAIAARANATAAGAQGTAMSGAATGATTLGASLLRLAPYAAAAAGAIALIVESGIIGRFENFRSIIADNADSIKVWSEETINAARSVGEAFIGAGSSLINYLTGVKNVPAIQAEATGAIKLTKEQTDAMKATAIDLGEHLAMLGTPLGIVADGMTTMGAAVNLATGRFKEMQPVVEGLLQGLQSHVGQSKEAWDAWNLSLRQLKPSLDQVAIGVKQADTAQSDLVGTVNRLQGVLAALKKSSDGSKDSIAEIIRVTNQLKAANDAAYPSLKGVEKAQADATITTNESSKAIDSYSEIIQKFPGLVTGSMSQFKQAIIDGFNPNNAIKSIDTLVAKMQSLAAAGDKDAAEIANFFEKGRASIIAMMLALDPTKMQSFSVGVKDAVTQMDTSVTVLKGSMANLGQSASEMAAAVSKGMNIPLAAATEIVKTWAAGVKDSGQAITGMTQTVMSNVPATNLMEEGQRKLTGTIHGLDTEVGKAKTGWVIFAGSEKDAGKDVKDLTGLVDGQIKILNGVGSAAKNATGGMTSLQQAQQLTTQSWQVGADSAGKVALAVANIGHAEATAVNQFQVAKEAFDRINDEYDRGQRSVQELARAVQAYTAAAQAAIDPTGKLGGNVAALSAAANKAGGSLATAAGSMDKAASKGDLVASALGIATKNTSSFAQSLDGSSTSLTNYIGLLAAMGAALDVIANAAAAAGFPFSDGLNSFISVDEANKRIATSGGKNQYVQQSDGSIQIKSGYTKDSSTDQFGRPLGGSSSSSSGDSGGGGGGGTFTGNVNIDTSQASQSLSALASAADSLSQALNGVGTAAQSASAGLQAIGSQLSSATAGVASSLSSLASGVQSSTSTLANALNGSAVTSAIQTLSSGITSAAGSIQSGGDKSGGGGAASLTTAFADVASSAGAASSSLKTLAASVGSASGSASKSSAAGLDSALTQLAKSGENLQNEFDKMKDAGEALGHAMDSAGASAADSTKGIGRLGDGADNTAKSFTDLNKTIDAAHQLIDHLGKSADDAQKSVAALAGSANGAVKALDPLADSATAAKRSIDSLSDAAASCAKSIQALGEAAANAAKSVGSGGGVGGGTNVPISGGGRSGAPIYIAAPYPIQPGQFNPFTSLSGGAITGSAAQSSGVTVNFQNAQFIGTPDTQTVRRLGDAIMTYTTNQLRQQAGQKV